MADLTKSGLQPAMIVEAEESGSSISVKSGGKKIPCMFNPYEYTVAQSNQYQMKYQNGADVPKMVFSGAGEKTLQLKLTFDTYEQKTDVSLITRKLWELMQPSVENQQNQRQRNQPKKHPSPVAFVWGAFEFFAVIKSCSQKFTLFLENGTPVRAEVTVSFSQHLDSNEYTNQPQNPTSGGGPLEEVWQVKAGDRLDLIAFEVYNDATKWRLIADRNSISNPLGIRTGQRLRIPPR